MTNRSARLALLAAATLASAAWCQASSDVVADGRQLARQVTAVLQSKVGARACQHAVKWVIAVDISGSTTGAWQTCVVGALHDLAKYVVAPGDSIEIIPFDRDVDPAQPDEIASGQRRPREYTVDADDRSGIISAMDSLIRVREGVKTTGWAPAMRQALKKTAAAAPDRLGVCLLLSDRASDDDDDSDSAARRYDAGPLSFPGVSAPLGAALTSPKGTALPFSRDYFVLGPEGSGGAAPRIEVFLALSSGEAQPAMLAPKRQVPPSQALGAIAHTPAVQRVEPHGQRAAGALLLVAGLCLAGIGIWQGHARSVTIGERSTRSLLDWRCRLEIEVTEGANSSTESGAVAVPILTSLSKGDRGVMLESHRLVGTVTKNGFGVHLQPAQGVPVAYGESVSFGMDRIALEPGKLYQVQFGVPEKETAATPQTTIRAGLLHPKWSAWAACGGVLLILGLLVLATAETRVVPEPVGSVEEPHVEWFCGR